MKYIKLLLCIFFALSLSSCGSDSAADGASAVLGGLDGTAWELSYVGVSPGYGYVTDDNWYANGFMAYADHVGLPYEKLVNQVSVMTDTVSSESIITHTLSFSKGACEWTIGNATTYKLHERTIEYERYKFAPQDFLVPCRFVCDDADACDTLRVSADELKYLYYKQFSDREWFVIPLENGVYFSQVSSSTKELPDAHIAEMQQSAFTSLKVEPTSFIMQRGDEIYSAQYDVAAGWLFLRMLSPEHKEIGKFEIKK